MSSLFRRLRLIVLMFAAGLLILVGGIIYISVSSSAADGRYGTVSVPGQAVMQLPAGTAKMTYFDSYPGFGTHGRAIFVPGFRLSVDPVSGGKQAVITFKQSSSSGSSSTNGTTTQHVQVGTVQVPAAGQYRVVVSDATGVNGQNPQLRFGTSVPLNPVQLVAIILGPVLIVGAVLTGILSFRRRRPIPGPPDDVYTTSQVY